MADSTVPANQPVKIRKYPNRRYYDISRSKHVTLEEIYRLVRNGSDVEVTDSKTGEDITAKVLAQIILDHDPPKMGVFPVQLLHEVIRSNESLVRDFVEKYFHQAFMAFATSQQQFDKYLRESLGLAAPLQAGSDWAQAIFSAFRYPFLAGVRGSANSQQQPVSGNSTHAGENQDLERRVGQLQDEVRALREELKRR